MVSPGLDREARIAGLLERHGHTTALDPDLLRRRKEEVIGEYGDELQDLGRMVCVSEMLGKVFKVPMGLVHPNPHQPRQFFDEEKLDSLEALILNNGQQREI